MLSILDLMVLFPEKKQQEEKWGFDLLGYTLIISLKLKNLTSKYIIVIVFVLCNANFAIMLLHDLRDCNRAEAVYTVV